ncbi:metal transporter [Paraburkholderia rhizosphaerae]|uniref:Multidrug efflux pump subunit AcrA (Membrane-fusion protein) n=1 Tax=Paraburkholderia rhizosphaerae TaxID=480658 RepID=A0A4R8LC83_9BURK|nr:metal transporter [Paraburkholderia rhizosphaerae]TDY40541.1 hypothetical protein BX592_12454 [Paraburkholderia rhizosphaerae]
MKSRLLLCSALLSVLVVGGAWFTYLTLAAHRSAQATEPSAAQRPAVQTVNGETVLVVSREMQRASHIEVSALSVITAAPARTAYATVVDLQSLFDLRNRLAAARADLDTFSAQAANSRVQFARSQTLFDDDRNVSRKTLQDADAAMQADAAKLRNARAALAGIDAMLRLQFGDALAKAAAAATSDLYDRLQTGRAAVVRMTLPVGESGEMPPQRITVDAPDGAEVVAQRLSASPVVDPAVQGEPWLYVTARPLPAGMRASAHVPAMRELAAASLAIPARAVLWYGGQTWVYVKTAPDRFARRFVPVTDSDNRDIIVTESFNASPNTSPNASLHAGDEVVTQGAQLLLSEELKPQGIATVCKDPPECDD